MGQPASAVFPWSVVPEPGAGEKRTGYIRWRDDALRGWQWPYIAVRGHEPGPAVAITAAVHGGEYPGILGALRLARLLQPERVSGSLLILPVVNQPSFWARSAFLTPPDGKNQNRVFPGNALGTATEVLAWRLMEEIIGPADVLIDLHSGDVFETLAAHVVRYEMGDAETDALTHAMCVAFGLPFAITYPRPTRSGSMSANAALSGPATVVVEVGGNALASDADVQTVFQGLINALRVAGVLGGLVPETDVRWLQAGRQLTAPADALWRSAVTVGMPVSKGDVLGTLTDQLGEDLAQPTSEVDGIAVYTMSALAVREGDPLVYVAPLADD